MSTRASMSTRAISLNLNDVEGAALALVALSITQPEIEDTDEYGDLASQIMEDYCSLLRTPDELLPPEERKAAEHMQVVILSKASKMKKALLLSGDPLIRALTAQPTTAE